MSGLTGESQISPFFFYHLKTEWQASLEKNGVLKFQLAIGFLRTRYSKW